jgi:uncharacterized protein (TIGR02145 family)
MKKKILILVFSTSALLCYTQENKTNDSVESDKLTVKDIDGNVYKTVKIGSHLWMKENLKTTHYRNGDPIPTTNPPSADIRDQEKENISPGDDLAPFFQTNLANSNDKMPKYQWPYNGDETNVSIYGRLYTWYTVTDSRNICPDGWHVSTDRDWGSLISSLGGMAIAGGKLKAQGSSFWAEPNAGATDETGFSALGGGGRDTEGRFNGLKEYGAWWTSASGQFRHIEHDNPYTYRAYHYSSKLFGFSVRCVKD